MCSWRHKRDDGCHRAERYYLPSFFLKEKNEEGEGWERRMDTTTLALEKTSIIKGRHVGDSEIRI